MNIRRLTSLDVAPYRDLMLHAYEAAPDSFVSTVEERATEPEAWWLRRIADPREQSFAFGAFHNGALVGTSAIEFSPRKKAQHRARLIGMFVRESQRGSGAGRQLVEAALAAAREREGIQIVTLTVTEGNSPAISLYESVGFRSFGVEPMAIATSTDFRSKVHMWVPIGEESAGGSA